ncbi:hypothetical protein [Sodalis sp.]|uniref:hypothetical protein n=1 Tax=Sodalis sp. (in: enterobacteria) TaxID=1898979 RepID=UPI0038735B2D
MSPELDMPARSYDFSSSNALRDYPAVDLSGVMQRQRRITPLIVAQIRDYGAARRE